MRNIFLFISLFIIGSIAAQWRGDVLGKTFYAKTSVRQTIAYHIPNAETLLQLKQELKTQLQVSSLSNSEMVLKVEVKEVKGELDAFGQIQKFDSNKQDSISAEEKKLITDWLSVKTYSISNTTVTSSNAGSATHLLPEDIRSYFLTENRAQAKAAFTWVDSVKKDSSISIYECTVLKNNNDSIQIHVFATHELKNAIQQGDQQFRQTIKGVERATRWYEKKTGVLARTQRLLQFEGTAENQDTRFPISMKVEVESIVNSH